MMQLPQLMSRIWDGDPNEYFSYKDMNRVEYNANILAEYSGIPIQDFIKTTRASQFHYGEAQKLENLISAIGKKLGVPINIESHWNFNRTISCIDFERWESELWKLYKKMGGIGDRIPSDKTLHTINLTLFADSWRGAGPYYQDMDVSSLGEDAEAIAYVAENATVAQRLAEYNAGIQVIETEPRHVRVYAHNIKPTENIPVKITTKAFKMFKSIVLKSNAWQGSGPWTQAVDLGSPVTNAVIGSDNRNNSKQFSEFAEAVIGVSDISGSVVTVRAVSSKPTMDVNASIMWSEGNVS